MEQAALSAFPAPRERRGRRASRHARATPPPIVELFEPALADEGVWHNAGWTLNHVPALRCAVFRPDSEHPRVVVGVARFTRELTRFVLVPGTQDPGGEWSWHGGIPEDQRGALLAAFNSGFRTNESRGGFYVEGKLVRPLVANAASIVISDDGNLDVLAWPENQPLEPQIVAVRQNLRLIVDGGEVVSGLAQNAGGAWGFTLNQGYYTWRSGLGIARDGSLMYLAGDGLTLVSLATALRHAGALRAMELDIHDQWSTFNVFTPSLEQPGLQATKLLPSMPRPAERYLAPDDRDFIAAFIR
ncbi:MAG: phosphodiester glycosidase family protein [Polyangiaceae bacterium]